MPYKCREKQREHNRRYQAKWYKANKAARIALQKQYRKDARQWYNDHKRLYSCRKCGENHPAAIDFHHNDPAKKEMLLAYVVKHGWSKSRILAEIAKCTPLCATCHRIFHAELEAGNTPSIDIWLADNSTGRGSRTHTP